MSFIEVKEIPVGNRARTARLRHLLERFVEANIKTALVDVPDLNPQQLYERFYHLIHYYHFPIRTFRVDKNTYIQRTDLQ
jgi:hypothetical protein